MRAECDLGCAQRSLHNKKRRNVVRRQPISMSELISEVGEPALEEVARADASVRTYETCRKTR